MVKAPALTGLSLTQFVLEFLKPQGTHHLPELPHLLLGILIKFSFLTEAKAVF